MPDLATRQSWAELLPGISLDAVRWSGDKVIAASVGITSGIHDSPTRVCRRVEQGAHFTEDCVTDYLRRPELRGRAHGSFLLSLPRVAGIGDFQIGMQVSFVLVTATATVDGMARKMFGEGSWHYKASLPLYLTTSELPWGLAAGIAPELSRAIDSSSNEEVRLLFFVGARSPVAPQR
jgi:hypothetical protein